MNTAVQELIKRLDCVPVDAEGKEMPSKKTIMEIQAEFAKRYPDREKSKRQGGNNITYIPWYEVVSIANAVTEGHWDYRIVSKGHYEAGAPSVRDVEERIRDIKKSNIPPEYQDQMIAIAMGPQRKFEMVVGVTIYAADGTFYCEGTGTEDSSTDNWGDYQSIAESMALRRAFTKFQLGIYMYRK